MATHPLFDRNCAKHGVPAPIQFPLIQAPMTGPTIADQVVLKPWDVDVVVHHFPCTDGYAAALVAYQYFCRQRPYVRFYGVTHKTRSNLAAVVNNRRVLFLDIAPLAKDIRQWNMRSFLVLDHHTTSVRSLQGVPDTHKYLRTSSKHSGVTLAWQYFFPGYALPTLFEAIRSNDVYDEDLQTKNYLPIITGLSATCGHCASCWSDMCQDLHTLATVGEIIVRKRDYSVREYVKRAQVRYLGGYRCWVINITDPQCVDGTGNQLVSREDCKQDIAVLWRYVMEDKHIKLSLRSLQKEGPDVSKLAELFQGGGGSPHSASFTYPGSDIEAVFDEKAP
jgi:hypothetical protein